MRKYNEENNKIKEEPTIKNIPEEKEKRKWSFEENQIRKCSLEENEGKKMLLKQRSVQFAQGDEEVDKEAALSSGGIEK